MLYGVPPSMLTVATCEKALVGVFPIKAIDVPINTFSGWVSGSKRFASPSNDNEKVPKAVEDAKAG